MFLNRYFWYLKESEATICLIMEDDTDKSSDSCNSDPDLIQTAGCQTNIKQARIDCCQYQLSKVQIRSWLNLYREVHVDMVKEAILDPTDK
jgi:hypothetical protein